MSSVIIVEKKSVQNELSKAPKEVLISYETWARLIEEHGFSILRKIKGYHDEKLKGDMSKYRSSRLNRKWRVFYSVTKEGVIEIVEVVKVTPHDYRRL